MNVWPWGELGRLRVELRATKLACSAEAKKVNRLAARIRVLDRAIEKHRGQERHDQAYIDILEAKLDPPAVKMARVQVVTGIREIGT